MSISVWWTKLWSRQLICHYVICTFPKSEELPQHSCQWLFITSFILQINPAFIKAGDISIDSGWILLTPPGNVWRESSLCSNLALGWFIYWCLRHANSAVKIPPFSSRLGDIEMSRPSLSGFWNRGSKDKSK